MQEYQERAVKEKEELDEKINKLKRFCYGANSVVFEALPHIDKELLTDQYTAMKQYSAVLGRRIERFKKEEQNKEERSS